jgi:hypothetical protein
MFNVIEDGTGGGFRARVSSQNRLSVDANSMDMITVASLGSAAFAGNTGLMTLTSASESALFNLKNNDDNNLVLGALTIHATASTGGSGLARFRFWKNISGGTIISNATPMDARFNLNLGSSVTLAADIFKGGEGVTQTGGVTLGDAILTLPTRTTLVTGGVVLPRGASYGVTVVPPTGNTSWQVGVLWAVFRISPQGFIVPV